MAHRPEAIESVESVQDVLSRFDHFMLDCDGVLWHSAELLPNALNTLALLK
jgi:ribonucleotide monophosphatase NagD (HAD superfamily)